MTTLKSLVDEVVNIKNDITNCYTSLKNILIDKNIQIKPNDKLIDLIKKVKNLYYKVIVAGDEIEILSEIGGNLSTVEAQRDWTVLKRIEVSSITSKMPIPVKSIRLSSRISGVSSSNNGSHDYTLYVKFLFFKKSSQIVLESEEFSKSFSNHLQNTIEGVFDGDLKDVDFIEIQAKYSGKAQKVSADFYFIEGKEGIEK